MRDLLDGARQRLLREIDPHSTPPDEPNIADQSIVSSLMQKAIRRGEIKIAQRAALTLLQVRGSAIWRRFIVIAFEDVGIGNVDAVTMTVAAGSDASSRKACGGNLRVAVHIAGILADAAKDRSADYLVGAKDHPALVRFADTMANGSIELILSSLPDATLALPQRAVAALFASGLSGQRADGTRSKGNLDVLLAAFRELGVAEDLVAAAGIAAARTREPIVIVVPLIWLAAEASRDAKVCTFPVPPLVRAGDVPLYALDEHTRLGRQAIWRFAGENDDVRTCLESFVPANQRRRAANVAAYYVDAAPVSKRLVWDQSDALEGFGIERDLIHAGVPLDGIAPLIEAMRANLGQLNEVRAQVLARSGGLQDTMPVNRADAGITYDNIPLSEPISWFRATTDKESIFWSPRRVCQLDRKLLFLASRLGQPCSHNDRLWNRDADGVPRAAAGARPPIVADDSAVTSFE